MGDSFFSIDSINAQLRESFINIEKSVKFRADHRLRHGLWRGPDDYRGRMNYLVFFWNKMRGQRLVL
ncbi:MAG: hypothetical protein COA41_06485 [Sphingopyxis sp.]|nr:MAG: hypothetical protein COA41_06485 [Sphingopyxis sp.]